MAYESYPKSTIILTNLINLLVSLAGLYLTYLIHPILSLLLLILILYLEFSVYKEGCKNCYYYGKLCAFGRGKLAKLFFKKGDPKKFTEKAVSFKDFIIPSLPSIITVLAGIYLLIKDFSIIILIITLWPLIVLFILNQFTFGKLVCPNCKQAELCCPVCEFFKKRAMKK